MTDLKIENIATVKLVPYARNSRTHSDAQIGQIAASIVEFGFTNPVLIDSEGGIIAGHGRVLAALQLCREVVPCLRLGHLTEDQKKAYVIADNQIALNAGWDFDQLRADMAALEGFQLRYIYFLNAEARKRLTVPILPFSAIDEAGARMYKGEKPARPKGQDTGCPPVLGG